LRFMSTHDLNPRDGLSWHLFQIDAEQAYFPVSF
jgi:hypothetical protein